MSPTGTAVSRELVQLETRRFGTVAVAPDQLYWFPHGLPGFLELRQFAMLPVNTDVAWLQSTDSPAIAFLIARASRVRSGAWPEHPHAWAIVTLADPLQASTANLRAPVILNRLVSTGFQWISEVSQWSATESVDLTQLVPGNRADAPGHSDFSGSGR